MTAPARARRVEARRNRDAVRDAARKVFAQEGLDAPLGTFARAARVDRAPLCRHFGTREKHVEQADPARARGRCAPHHPSTAVFRHTRPEVRRTLSKHAATADISRSCCGAAWEQRRAYE